MIRSARRLVAGAASFGAAAAIGALPATATAPKPTHVAIVVRLSNSSTITACVTQGGDGLDVLVRGFPNTDIPTSGPYAGFVVTIDDVGQNPPDDTHYWSYWHGTPDGWKYSSTGGGSYTPGAGAVEGWSYVDGQNKPPKPALYSYRTLCGDKDPQPAPTSTHPSTHPGTHPARTSTSAAPTTRHSSTRHSSTWQARTRPANPGTSPSTPSSATASVARRHGPTSHSSAGHHLAAGHTGPPPPATTGSETGPSATPGVLSSAAAAPAPSPSLQPTATQRSSSGFPAWGTALAIVVVAGLGGTAWLRSRRRPE